MYGISDRAVLILAGILIGVAVTVTAATGIIAAAMYISATEQGRFDDVQAVEHQG